MLAYTDSCTNAYGHLYVLFTQKAAALGFGIGHRYLAPLWLLLFGVGLYLSFRWRKLPQLASGLNAMSLVAVLLPLAQITRFELQPLISPADRWGQQDCNLALGSEAPDIYHIVLDAYTRADVLREFYHHDNAPFLKALKKKGFYVAYASQSNYAHTFKSLASTLNLNYLSDLGLIEKSTRWALDPTVSNRRTLANSIANNTVRRELECLGYATYGFGAPFPWSAWKSVLSQLTGMQPGTSNISKGLTPFEAMLVRSSGLLLLQNAGFQVAGLLRDDQFVGMYRQHYQRILSELDRLKRLSRIPGPKFVFAHILAPHAPLVFSATGAYVAPGEGKRGPIRYREEVIYLNTRIERLVTEILHNSETPPIIILQGDHGYSFSKPEYRVAILNAYYLPDVEKGRLYPSITPVNSFRVVFDTYFSGRYGLTEDISYYSPHTWLYEDLQVVPNSWPITRNRAIPDSGERGAE